MRRGILIGALTTLVVMLVAATAAPLRADEWSKTYQVVRRADLHVTTDDGNVSIIAADQKQIDARVITEGYKIGPHEVAIEDSQNGDYVTVKVKLPHWNFELFSGLHRSVNVELKVPRELDLHVHTGDGNVSAQAASGRIHIDTGDGNLTTDDLKGDISMHSGDGNIQGTNLDGSLRVDTGDGNVTVRGRFDALDLRSGDGNIDADATTGSKIAGVWTLHSGDGQINLRVPAHFQADVDAHTGDGSITLDIPISVEGSLSHSSVRGKMNGGGGQLMISTGDGSIHLGTR
jgi:DUF4097 and DUF4098 domain-containing protein YvlB